MDSIHLDVSYKIFEGTFQTYSFYSQATNCNMKFGIFLPKQVQTMKCPVIYFLVGLGCEVQQFSWKATIGLKKAAELGIVMVFPDTSPKDVVIEGDREVFDLGIGAGYYLDALEEKWKKHYNMYTHVVKDIREVINSKFNVLEDKQSIFGHSMGGMGALNIYIKNPDLYKCCSAFAPITTTLRSKWGQKALKNFIGEERKSEWKNYDPTEVLREYKGPTKLHILIDQGDKDKWLEEELKPEEFVEVAHHKDKDLLDLVFNWREGYDHNYGFISTFVESHIEYHYKFLTQ